MKIPNLTLMQHYNTAATFKEKAAGAESLAARVGAAIVNAGFSRHAHDDSEKQRLQAMALNDQFHAVEREWMEAADQGLHHTRVPMMLDAGSDYPLGMTDGMVRLASACGSDMAKLAKGVAPKPFVAPMKNYLAGMPGPKPAAPVGAVGASKPAPMLVSPNVAAFTAKPGVATPTTAPTARAATPSAAPAAKPTAPPPAAAKPAASPAGKGGLAGFMSQLTPGRLLGTAGILGAGALAMKGVHGALGALSSEPRVPTYGASGQQPPMGVNEYGQPQAGTPLY